MKPFTLALILAVATCGEPSSSPTTRPPACLAPPTDVVIVDPDDVVARSCAPIGEPAPMADTDVFRVDLSTITFRWTGGCEVSSVVVTPLPDGHRFTIYPSERDCVRTLGLGRSVTLITRRPLGRVEYMINHGH